MFQTAAGVSLPFPEQLREGFSRADDRITVNLSFEKLSDFVLAFVTQIDAPVFLALHVPIDETHDRLYYLDGCTLQQFQTIWQMYGELLCQDGLSSFAVASHATGEELFVESYKVMQLYSPRIERFVPLLTQFDLAETDSLTTAWDTVSAAHPGGLRLVDIDGVTIFDAVEELQQIGLYEAETD